MKTLNEKLYAHIYRLLTYNDFEYFDEYTKTGTCVSSMGVEYKGEGFYRVTKQHGAFLGDYKLAISKKEIEDICNNIESILYKKDSPAYNSILKEYTLASNGLSFNNLLLKHSLRDFKTKLISNFDKMYKKEPFVYISLTL